VSYVSFAPEVAESVLAQLEPAPDYMAPHWVGEEGWVPHRRGVGLAILEGLGSIVAPFDGLSDMTWSAAPWRDVVFVGTDMWTAVHRYQDSSGFLVVDPGQEQLFDPAKLGT
jgi:hypothetical protein